jgi:uncharacterized protein
VLGELATGLMLLPDDADEVEMLRRRRGITDRDRRRLGLTLVPSSGCNFDCPYCFEDKPKQRMAEPVAAAIQRLVAARLPDLDAFSVTWYGGEPLLGRTELLALSSALRDLCAAGGVQYAASIVTNGYLLTRTTAERLRAAGIGAAQVTLDGPADVHNCRRPLVSGRGTFDRIVANVVSAVDVLAVSVRVNIDVTNADRYEELLVELADRGLAGRIQVYPAQVVATAASSAAPSASYGSGCFTSREFSDVELRLQALTAAYGFGAPGLPRPVASPCTAVRPDEIVVGSSGELYKCWESVGNPDEVIGHIGSYPEVNERVRKWIDYDPFTDTDCRRCIALPVCMGGCAAHALDPDQHENRCGSFRFAHERQVGQFVDVLAGRDVTRLSYPRPGGRRPPAPAGNAVPDTGGRRQLPIVLVT